VASCSFDSKALPGLSTFWSCWPGKSARANPMGGSKQNLQSMLHALKPVSRLKSLSLCFTGAASHLLHSDASASVSSPSCAKQAVTRHATRACASSGACFLHALYRTSHKAYLRPAALPLPGVRRPPCPRFSKFSGKTNMASFDNPNVCSISYFLPCVFGTEILLHF
jgi:hypothetical protein